eukprot:TRINITY_DN702_c0_g1_i1.p2 TRINITY_DN702_c0_g1~~TRINITY_DN702_c0_g1_i1.p2  ORF type:complete len:102 (-),score=15.33 TRINITY_DN702_c0_g1_i1:129-434(-)
MAVAVAMLQVRRAADARGLDLEDTIAAYVEAATAAAATATATGSRSDTATANSFQISPFSGLFIQGSFFGIFSRPKIPKIAFSASIRFSKNCLSALIFSIF